MMKKVQLMITLFVMLAQHALAQGEQATVHLNNGSILNGLLAKSNTENKYRMRIPNGSLIFFNGKEVASILRNNNTPLPNTTGMAGEAGTAYLNNGSIVKGKIRKSGNSEKYRAVLPNGSIFFFSENLVKTIQYEMDDWGDEQEDDWGDKRGGVPVQAQKDERITNRFLPEPPARRITGYRGFLDVGYNFSHTSFMYDYYYSYGVSYKYLTLTTTHGGQIGPYFFIGGGLGIQYYPRYREVAVPVFIDMRINVLHVERSDVIPFFKLQLGSLVVTDGNDAMEALYIASYLGVKFMTGRRSAINLQAGYSYTSDYIRGINLKIGFEF